MPRGLLFIASLIYLLLANSVMATTVVNVLAYPFPPFLNDDKKTGLTADIIKLFNKNQSRFDFKLMVVKPQERYQPILSGKAHMMLFEMPEWNWQEHENNVQFSKLLLKGGEVYVAKRHRDQLRFDFEQIENRRIMAYEGYHYTFADMNADQNWLKSNFNIAFTNSHPHMLKAVKSGEVDIAVVTLSFLKQYFHDNPQDLLTYVISQQFAQVYKLRALVAKESPLKLTELEDLLHNLKNNNALQPVLETYGVLRQWQF
ncbi:MAG: transporter substrate-binding domain-containing protein [Methylocystaceae bacterium]|nr:transporter substrate-binding domain-containing protein [Methylocystaceae bacterium]